jgi:DNA-binding NarL/FixJ family response regulator
VSGLTAIPQFHELNPGMRVVVMSGSAHDETASDAIAAGAAAYLEKGPLEEGLVQTLVAVGRERQTAG